MKFNKTEVFNFEGAFRGIRNALESWDKSDSTYCLLNEDMDCNICGLHNRGCNTMMGNSGSYLVGKEDLKLAQKLILAGDSHSKFMRQILVSYDITAPLYFFKEFDTYKINTVANSTSTIHKLSTTPITMDCFEIEDFNPEIRLNGVYDGCTYSLEETFVPELIDWLEQLRLKYLGTNDKKYWKELIRWLPESWLQTRTITMNYSNLRNIYFQRRNHKLTEWSVDFINWIETLPYAKELIMLEVK